MKAIKSLVSIGFLFLWISSNSQNQSDDYFIFYKGGKKYQKPKKYILFEKEKGERIENASGIYFYIQGNRFKYTNDDYDIDTISVSSLKNIHLSKVNSLTDEELEFHKKMIDKDGYWKELFETRPPIPITKNHPYFQVFILEKENGKILKYRVNWEYSHPLPKKKN
jgi:hypothetical protein